jgi:protein-S-isoprenylcysteine O-methyltransferase Ste14
MFNNKNKKQSRDHRNRNDLTEEHPLTDAGQFICFFVFIICWSLDSFLFRLSVIPLACIPIYVKIGVAVPLLLLSLYMGITSHTIVFDEIRDPPSVISKGVFSRVRHPLYASELLLYAGLVVTTGSLLSFVVLVIIFIFFNYIVKFEEEKLEEKFGEDYVMYKKRVGKWFPKFHRKKHRI